MSHLPITILNANISLHALDPVQDKTFLDQMWSDQGFFLVQKTFFILDEVVNMRCAALCNTPSVWRSSPLSLIQAPKSGQLL